MEVAWDWEILLLCDIFYETARFTDERAMNYFPADQTQFFYNFLPGLLIRIWIRSDLECFARIRIRSRIRSRIQSWILNKNKTNSDPDPE